MSKKTPSTRSTGLPGRPPLPQAVRRSRAVKLCMTPVEYAAIAKMAQKDERSVAAYLIRVIRAHCAGVL